MQAQQQKRLHMTNVSTGYAMGRPRKGEVRPLTIGGLRSAKWREDQLKKNAKAYRMQQAIFQQLYRKANPELRRTQQNAANARRKGRNDPNAIFVIA